MALAAPQGARLELRDLARALAKLPEEQRSVILLVGMEGIGYDEAATAVKLPVGTVRSRVSRGRESLRAMTGLFPARHSHNTQARASPRKDHFKPFVQRRRAAPAPREAIQ